MSIKKEVNCRVNQQSVSMVRTTTGDEGENISC